MAEPGQATAPSVKNPDRIECPHRSFWTGHAADPSSLESTPPAAAYDRQAQISSKPWVSKGPENSAFSPPKDAVLPLRATVGGNRRRPHQPTAGSRSGDVKTPQKQNPGRCRGLFAQLACC
jgi:hypothetical protein